MIKRKFYAMLNGVLYPAQKISANKYCLTATETCPEGFIAPDARKKVFYKNVTPEEIDMLYCAQKLAVYEGQWFRLERCDRGQAVLTTPNPRLAEEFSLMQYGDVYACRVPAGDLTRTIEYITFYG